MCNKCSHYVQVEPFDYLGQDYIVGKCDKCRLMYTLDSSGDIVSVNDYKGL
jgi:hypothetical protein